MNTSIVFKSERTWLLMPVKILQILCIMDVIIFVLPYNTLSSGDNHINHLSSSGINLKALVDRLYCELYKNTPEENMIYSPLSVKTCLAMTRMGADKETAEEMDKILELSGKNSEDLARSYHDILKKHQNSLVLTIANKIYIAKDYEVQKDFNETLFNQFFASIDSIDFNRQQEAATDINNWVKLKTNNTIKDLISADGLGVDSRLVLVNAIHFKGKWVHPFNKEMTSNTPFHLNEDLSFNVPMMTCKGKFKYANLPNLKADALEMPYKDSNLSMLIILPQSATGLAYMEEELHGVTLDEIIKQMRAMVVEVQVPRFKVEFKAELSKPLSDIGMKRMFSTYAEFNKMVISGENLRVSSFVHKAFIEVNEEGTEAAAASGLGIMTRSMPTTFIVNKPFYFTIKDEKNTKIFEGRINGKF